MENKIIELYETRLEDAWGREILKDESGKIYKWVEGVPHSITEAGEPGNSVNNYRLISLTEQLGYDPNSYPDNFDPVLWGLEERKKQNNEGLSL